MREDLQSLHVKYWLLCASRSYYLVEKEPQMFTQRDDLEMKSFALHLFVSKQERFASPLHDYFMVEKCIIKYSSFKLFMLNFLI